MAKDTRKTYQLKITLMGSKPSIWRRFLIGNGVTLPELHGVIQIVMGWTDSHLHQFIAGKQAYGAPDPDFGDGEVLDERKFLLGQLLEKEKDSLVYEYDFGDGWCHKIVLEKILPFDLSEILPRCTAGKRACPPEDVGGMWGYANFLQAISDPGHPEHEEYLAWGDENFDPAAFDVDSVNADLLEYCR